jgi:hypothetical protein
MTLSNKWIGVTANGFFELNFSSPADYLSAHKAAKYFNSEAVGVLTPEEHSEYEAQRSPVAVNQIVKAAIALNNNLGSGSKDVLPLVRAMEYKSKKK